MQQSVNTANNYTTYITKGIWNGQEVEVDSPFQCDFPGHTLEVMTHYGHPTQYLMCKECAGSASNPLGQEPECTWEQCWCRIPWQQRPFYTAEEEQAMEEPPNIHPTRDTAAQLLRDQAEFIERLAERLIDGKFRVLTADAVKCDELHKRYLVFRRQQNAENWQAAQGNSQD